jgi:hypothetical protein
VGGSWWQELLGDIPRKQKLTYQYCKTERCKIKDEKKNRSRNTKRNLPFVKGFISAEPSPIPHLRDLIMRSGLTRHVRFRWRHHQLTGHLVFFNEKIAHLGI